jgi:hypothetical protein
MTVTVALAALQLHSVGCGGSALRTLRDLELRLSDRRLEFVFSEMCIPPYHHDKTPSCVWKASRLTFDAKATTHLPPPTMRVAEPRPDAAPWPAGLVELIVEVHPEWLSLPTAFMPPLTWDEHACTWDGCVACFSRNVSLVACELRETIALHAFIAPHDESLYECPYFSWCCRHSMLVAHPRAATSEAAPEPLLLFITAPTVTEVETEILAIAEAGSIPEPAPSLAGTPSAPRVLRSPPRSVLLVPLRSCGDRKAKVRRVHTKCRRSTSPTPAREQTESPYVTSLTSAISLEPFRLRKLSVKTVPRTWKTAHKQR